MKATRGEVVREMMTALGQWVKEIVSEAERIDTPQDVSHLERRVVDEGRHHLAELLQGALQMAVDGQRPARQCPDCGGRRRHKGRRPRGPLSRLGALRLEGIYWWCPACGQSEHEATRLVGGSVTGWMRETLTLLGVSLASFEKAERVAVKVLGVSVDAETIRALTRAAGREASSCCLSAPPVAEGVDLVGSCDGTMVLTREAGWKEMKAYLFDHAGGRLGGAYSDINAGH